MIEIAIKTLRCFPHNSSNKSRYMLVADLPLRRTCSAVCVLISSEYLLLLLGMVSSYLSYPYDGIRNHCHFSTAVHFYATTKTPRKR